MSRRSGRTTDRSRQKFVQQLDAFGQAENFMSSLVEDISSGRGLSEAFFKMFNAPGMREIIKHCLFDTDSSLQPGDEEGSEYFFLKSFLADVSIDDENEIFSTFADFYACRSKRFSEFAEKVRTLEFYSVWQIGIRRYFLQMFVGLLYGGAKCGDTYSQSILKVLYQTYYKREYKTLKKFPCITWKELSLFSKDEDNVSLTMDTNTLSRILCMANVYHIDTTQCTIIYKMLDDIAEQEQEKIAAENDQIMEKSDNEEKQFVEDEKLHEEIDAFIERLPFDKNDELKLSNQMFEVIKLFILDFGIHPDQCETIQNSRNEKQFLAYTYWAIKRAGYKAEDIPIDTLAQIVEPFLSVICKMSDQTALFGAVADSMLLKYQRYNPSNVIQSVNNLCGAKKNVEQKPSKLQEAVKAVTSDVKTETETENENEALQKEIKELKEKLRVSQNDYDHLRKQYDSEKDQRKELEGELSEKDAERKELISLREFVYKEAKDDQYADAPQESSVSYEEMKKAVSDKSVLVIGGNDNWIKKMRNEFPKWKFVAANVSPTVSANIIKTCDKAYFFTDTLGHSNYAKFISLARTYNTDFSYMHGVNLRKNVQQVYEDFEKGNA